MKSGKTGTAAALVSAALLLILGGCEGSARLFEAVQRTVSGVLTVAYDANGATGSVPAGAVIYEPGDTVDVVGNTGGLSNDPLIFIGWNTAANGSATDYRPGDSFTMGDTSVTLYAQWAEQLVTVTAQDASDGAFFGSAVGIWGDYAIIGARGDSNLYVNDGSAYVYRRTGPNTWEPADKLAASEAAASSQFGGAVAISDRFAIVGARYEDGGGNSRGAAYIFERTDPTTWQEVDRIVAGDAADYDNFGNAVAISGEYAIVGALQDDDTETDSGSAYIFERQPDGQWLEVSKLTASDPEHNADFGWSVAISGTYAMVGALNQDDGGTAQGAVYVFERTGPGTWTPRPKLTAGEASNYDYFGTSVAISGEFAVVGAYYDGDGGTLSGAAYFYRRDGLGNWDETDRLLPSDGADNDQFGFSVGISGDHAVVGANENDTSALGAGRAYQFTHDGSGTWSEATAISSETPAENDEFGASAAIADYYMIVGEPEDDHGGYSTAGSVVIYVIAPE